MTESVFQGRSLLSTRDYTKDELMYLYSSGTSKWSPHW